MGVIGYTNVARTFPRIGALRKGGESSGGKWGKDLDHFRFTSDYPEVMQSFTDAYGKEPRTIRVFLPYKTTDENFVVWRKEYSAGGLVHSCDGRHVVRHRVGNQIIDVEGQGIECPYESGKKARTKKNPGCTLNARLNVIIPDIGKFGCVEVHTSAINDVVRIDAQLRALEDTRARFDETLQGVPFALTRVLEKISTPTDDGRARRAKWMVHLIEEKAWSDMLLAAVQNQAIPQLVSSSMPALASGESLDIETGEIVNDDDYHTGEYGERLDGVEPEPAITPLPEKPTATQTKQFHATGKELYGDEWDTKRGELAKSVSGGLTTSSKHLTRQEMQKLIDGMNAKKAA